MGCQTKLFTHFARNGLVNLVVLNDEDFCPGALVENIEGEQVLRN